VQAEPEQVVAWTDGACSGNPGPGAWGALLIFRGNERELCGFEAATTNNRMELMGAIAALEALKRDCVVHLHSDSQYVCKGIQEWLPGWIRRGWKTAAGKPVLNQDLWERLALQARRHRVHWHWVKGHSGVALNERVDRIARDCLERERLLLRPRAAEGGA
jgi:ribonuclease HI